jgi:hypothetical protein
MTPDGTPWHDGAMRDSLAERGTLSVVVDELNASGVRRPEFRKHLEDSAVRLSTLREALGGASGTIIDEFGDSHELSLEQWADHPPDTLLTIYFTFQQSNAPTGFRGSTYPPDVLDLVRACATLRTRR